MDSVYAGEVNKDFNMNRNRIYTDALRVFELAKGKKASRNEIDNLWNDAAQEATAAASVAPPAAAHEHANRRSTRANFFLCICLQCTHCRIHKYFILSGPSGPKKK